MGHKSNFIKTGDEANAVYRRHEYISLKNIHGLVKFYKRQINKRERRYNKNKIKGEIKNE